MYKTRVMFDLTRGRLSGCTNDKVTHTLQAVGCDVMSVLYGTKSVPQWSVSQ